MIPLQFVATPLGFFAIIPTQKFFSSANYRRRKRKGRRGGKKRKKKKIPMFWKGRFMRSLVELLKSQDSITTEKDIFLKHPCHAVGGAALVHCTFSRSSPDLIEHHFKNCAKFYKHAFGLAPNQIPTIMCSCKLNKLAYRFTDRNLIATAMKSVPDLINMDLYLPKILAQNMQKEFFGPRAKPLASTWDTKKCANCGSEKRLKKCGGCGLSAYCSARCQRSDWKHHKLVCASGRARGCIFLENCEDPEHDHLKDLPDVKHRCYHIRHELPAVPAAAKIHPVCVLPCFDRQTMWERDVMCKFGFLSELQKTTGCKTDSEAGLLLLPTYVRVCFTLRYQGENWQQMVWGKVIGCKSDQIFEVACLSHHSMCRIAHRDVMECSWNGKTTCILDTVPMMNLIGIKRYAKTRYIRNMQVYYQKYDKFKRDWQLWHDYLVDVGYDIPVKYRHFFQSLEGDWSKPPLLPGLSGVCKMAFLDSDELPKNFISPLDYSPEMAKQGCLCERFI